MPSLDRYAKAKLDQLDGLALRRTIAETGRADFPDVIRAGRTLLSFSCNDYLGLSRAPAVKAAAVAAVERYGVGAGASRLVTGNHPLYAKLEARLAAMKGTQDACVFGSGYLANIGVIGALVGVGDLILVDELAHACLNAGAKLAGAMVLRFRHNDACHAATLLEEHRRRYRHALLATETVFSMDGDRAPLASLAAVCGRLDTWLMSDDAHGFGLCGSDDAAVPLRMGTLSKAIGGYGGYLCASAPVIALMKTRARSLIYSTALPPASVAAASAALDIIAADPALAAEPLRKARLFTRLCGLPEAVSPIVPLVLGAPEAALAASAMLTGAGFLVAAIRPPTVPAGTARLRFAFSALHDDADIERLAGVLRENVLPLPALASA